MTAPLDLMEYSLYDPLQNTEFVFGGNQTTRYLVESAEFGDADSTLNDVPNPLDDGENHGREYKRGRTITFTTNVVSYNESAVQYLNTMASAWNAEVVRQTPQAYTVLRFNRHGRTRRVYGRPRKWAPVTGHIDAGWAPVIHDFRTRDNLYYSDAEYSNAVSIIPPPSGGWLMPFTFPVTPGGVATQQGEISIGGDKPAWLVSIINGPISNPIVEVANNWKIKLLTSIGLGEFIVINPRPWSRYVRKNGITNVRGAFTQDSVRLSQMKLWPGDYEVILSGVDHTGTSTLQTLWHEAYDSF